MLSAAVPATIVCEEPLSFECRDGLVYVTDPALGCIRAFRYATFYATFHNAAVCMQQCQLPAEGEVIRAFAVVNGDKA